MSILIDADTRVLVQGITGREGSFHTKQMLSYGTNVVAGVTPGKGGERVDGVPVFDHVEVALENSGANVSIVFVPAPYAMDAILEAMEANIPLVACVTEGIPLWDMLRVARYLQDKPVHLLGPNCPGVISPGVTKVGIMPGQIHLPGNVGVVSRSGTLTYEIVWGLTQADLGQSSCVGIGGDPIVGTDFVDILRLFEEDPQTETVVLIGEIGGQAEQRAAEFIETEMTKPVVAFVAGCTAPPGQRMGHAGAIVSGEGGRAEKKIAILRSAGALVAERPAQVAELLYEVMD
ncbi:MAG: succinate--CoA ligase subunit alpha [Anaerolineales bacterium]